MTSELVARALTFATAAHAAVGQLRKYSNLPYIVHPIAVAEIVKSVPHDEGMIAAALLHDVVEDVSPLRPEFGPGAIMAHFGADVAELVTWLTDVSIPADGNRAARKALDRAHSASAPARAQTIKVADLIHNTESIVARDPAFAKVYMREKADLLRVLVKADPALTARARAQILAYESTPLPQAGERV